MKTTAQRQQAIDALSKELRNLSQQPIEQRMFAYKDIIETATALYNLALTEQQYFPNDIIETATAPDNLALTEQEYFSNDAVSVDE